MRKILTAIAWAVAACSAFAQGQSGHDHAKHGDGLTSGEVRRIDKERGKITLRHGRIEALDMPPMTMVFEVRDPKLLDAVKAGDKVRFRVIKEPNGAYVVTDIERAQ